MIHKKLKEILSNVIKINIVDKIYLAELLQHNGKRYPVYAKCDEFEYIGKDDTVCNLGYIRHIEDVSFESFADTGCAVIYSATYSYRLVLVRENFKGSVINVNRLVLNNLLDKNIRLLRMSSNSNLLLRTEALYNKELNINPQLLYTSYDFTFKVTPFSCNSSDICEVENNIICS